MVRLPRQPRSPLPPTQSNGSAIDRGHITLTVQTTRDDADLAASIRAINRTVTTPAGDWSRYDQEVLHASRLYTVDRADGTVVGYVALRPGDYLSHMALLPRARGRGRGTRVVLDLLRRHGGVLHLHLRASNAAARHFYDSLKRHGVTVSVRVDGAYDDGDARLACSLSTQPAGTPH